MEATDLFGTDDLDLWREREERAENLLQAYRALARIELMIAANPNRSRPLSEHELTHGHRSSFGCCRDESQSAPGLRTEELA